MMWKAEILLVLKWQPVWYIPEEEIVCHAKLSYCAVCGYHSVQTPGCCKRATLPDPYYCVYGPFQPSGMA